MERGYKILDVGVPRRPRSATILEVRMRDGMQRTFLESRLPSSLTVITFLVETHPGHRKLAVSSNKGFRAVSRVKLN